MIENKLLKDFIQKVGDQHDWKKEDIEELVDRITFFEFVEDNEDLKFDIIYEFFFQLLNKWIGFKFYNDPIPALEDDPEYMENRKKALLEEADRFFNFGGLRDESQQNSSIK